MCRTLNAVFSRVLVLAKPDRLDQAGMGGHLKRRKRKQDIRASELENVTVSSAFDWDRLPLHLETIYADLKQLPWILLEPGSSQGKVVHDPFGKTIHGTNSPLHIGQVYRIGEAGMEWHSEPVPTWARILRCCSAEEAHRFAGRKLAKSKYYYLVLVD
jgi:hypothetical protein